jgi:hypothetical protein
MADAAKRLAGPAQVSNSAATKYTVPAATTTIIRHIHVFNADTGAVNFTMSIGADAVGTRLYDAYPILAKEPLDISCFLVLGAGETIQAFGSVTNKLTLTISGVEAS